MQFNSMHFLLFFPVVTLVFFIIPKKIRYIWLLIASYYFYMSWKPAYAILIFVSTLITYVCSLAIGKLREKNSPPAAGKIILAMGLISNLGILFFFKYFGLFISGLDFVAHFFGSGVSNPFDLVLPVGISFYTFQALGYLIDVYRGDTRAEKNFLRYALFVSFFPQLVAGPIERSHNLLSQLDKIADVRPQYERMVKGLIMMLWGFFMKVVIADRAAVVVNTVYDSFWSYGSFALFTATAMFALQIYCDFASYSTIASGAAKILGINLMDNFDTPYFSLSVREFWHRWHISLSTWFRDYLYIPLGGNRKGKARKRFNVMLTFILSGLWHGANLTFVLWGALHGAYQVIGDVSSPAKRRFEQKHKIDTETFTWKFLKMSVNNLLVGFAWIFFRSSTIKNAFLFIWRLFSSIDPWSVTNGAIYDLGLARQEMNILIIALAALTFVDILKRKRNIRIENIADTQNTFVRPALILALFFAVVIFGAYGLNFKATEFIYFQF